MISVNQVGLTFGAFDLFRDVTFMINPRDRIGLVGKNGAGKSTLLKIIAGIQNCDRGNIARQEGITVGYLPQQMTFSSHRSVWDETMLAFEATLALKKEIDHLAKQLEIRTDHESNEYHTIVDKFSELSARMSLVGEGSINAEIEKTLCGLGFEISDFKRATDEFSGGWRMRIELAKILLGKPDLFLLDEPTNHLDIESIQWLENYLGQYPGAVVVISHDRAFLDNVTNRTIELSLGKSINYKVAYSKYVELREERREQQMAAYTNQQKIIEDTREFIDRFRYKASKAVQVQSRIKQLDKIDIIEIDQEDTSKVHIKFPTPIKSGKLVIEIKGLSKSYGSRKILNNIDLIVESGNRIAFVGRNGEGKSTLSKIIAGELTHEGLFRLGHNVKLGYFAQNQDELLDEENTVLETIDRVAVGDIRVKIRDILGAFLFRGEDVDKKVQVLSGGERSRLAFAKLMLEPYNLLVLDEPTNHLDMRSKDVLKQALLKYEGTLVIVSHDRDFLNGLVDRVYEFSNNKIKEHIGGIQEFMNTKKIETFREFEQNKPIAIQVKKTQIESNTEKEPINQNTKQNHQDRKEHDRVIKKALNKVKETEEKIETIEKSIQKIEELLSNPQEIDSLPQKEELFLQYDQLKKQMDVEMAYWEQYQKEYELVQKK